MPDVAQSLCCADCPSVQAMKEEFDSPLRCIIDHPDFNSVVLNVSVLLTAYRGYKQQHDDETVNYTLNE